MMNERTETFCSPTSGLGRRTLPGGLVLNENLIRKLDDDAYSQLSEAQRKWLLEKDEMKNKHAVELSALEYGLQKQLEDAQGSCALIESRNQTLHSQLSELRNRHALEKEGLQRQLEESQRVCSEVEKRNQALLTQLAEERNKDALEVVKLQKQLEEAQRMCSYTERRNQTLIFQLTETKDKEAAEAAKLRNDLEEAQRRCSSVENRNETLLFQLTELKSKADKAQSDLISNESRRERERENMLKQHNLAEQRCEREKADLNAGLELLESRNRSLMDDLVNSQRTASTLKSQVDERQRQVDERQSQICRLEKDCQGLTAQLADERARRNTLLSDLDTKQQDVNGLEKRLASLQAQLDTMNTSYMRAKNDLSQQQASFQHLEQEKEKSIELLQNKINSMENQAYDLRSQMSKERGAHQKRSGSVLLKDMLTQWQNRHVNCAWRKWIFVNAILKGKEEMARQLEHADGISRARSLAEKEEACQELEARLRQEKEEEISRTKAKFMKERDQLLQDHEKKLRSAIADAKNTHHSQMKTREDAFNLEKESLIQRHSWQLKENQEQAQEEFNHSKAQLLAEWERAQKVAVQQEHDRMELEAREQVQKLKNDLLQAVEAERQRGKSQELQQEERHRKDLYEHCAKAREEARLQWESEKQRLQQEHDEIQREKTHDFNLKKQELESSASIRYENMKRDIERRKDEEMNFKVQRERQECEQRLKEALERQQKEMEALLSMKIAAAKTEVERQKDIQLANVIQEEKQRSQEECQGVSGELAKVESMYQELKRVCEIQQVELGRIKAALGVLEIEKSTLEQTYKDLQLEKDKLSRALNYYEDPTSGQMSQLRQEVSKANETQKRAEHERNKIVGLLNKENTTLKREKQLLSESLHAANDRIVVLEEDLGALRKNLGRAQKQAKESRSHSSDTIRSSEKIIQQFESQCQQAVSERQAKEKDIAVLRDQLFKIKQQYRRQEKENADLQSQIQYYKAQANEAIAGISFRSRPSAPKRTAQGVQEVWCKNCGLPCYGAP